MAADLHVDSQQEFEVVAAAAGVGALDRSRNLDIARAAAALAVLFGHAYQLSGRYISSTDRNPIHLLINSGGAGVWLFFALSGYLIAGPFVRALSSGTDLPSIRAYWVRRIARIYPAYVAALAFVFLFGLPLHVHARWWQYPLHFSLLQNLWPGEEQAIMFASWTLSIEMLFYVLVPVMASAARRLHKGAIRPRTFATGIASVWAGSILWTLAADRVHDPRYGLWLRILIPSMLSMFAPGVLVSVAVATWKLTGRPPRTVEWLVKRRLVSLSLAIALAAVGALGGTTTNVTLYDFSRQAFALASGLIVLLTISAREPRGLAGSVLGWFGYISYGIYLWQAVLVGIIEHQGINGAAPMVHTGGTAYVVHVAYLLAIVLPTAWLSWTLIEQPMIRWAKRRASRVRSRVPSVVTASA